jgi:organic radical activating enzyme
MKCSYCNETYYGGKKANYDLESVLKDLINSKNIAKKINIAWGGGEPVLLDDFDKIFEMVNEKMNPHKTMVYTNAIKYNNTIEKYLKDGKIKLTTSIDAGTKETFKKVRGVKALNKVLSNLKKYFSTAQRGIVIKYILTDDNYSDLEIHSFLDNIQKNELQNCEFQISSDFTDENISKEKIFSALKLYFGLKKLGTTYCFIDYHLRPRLQDAIKEFILDDDKSFKNLLLNYNPLGLKFEKIKQVIIWGAGDTGRNIINDSFILKKYNIKIKFIIDSDFNLHEKTICGLNVKEPSTVLKSKDPIVIASTAHYEEIQNYLNSVGVDKKRILDGIYF